MIASRAVMTDSGFWIALFHSRDQHHAAARNIPIDIEALPLLIPWPCLYETFSTRTAREPRRIALLMSALRHSNVQFLSDTPYRDAAFDAIDRTTPGRHRALSLVDHVVRFALADSNVSVSGLITFNPNDFRDVCARRGISLIPDSHARAR